MCKKLYHIFNSKFMLLGGARNVPTLCFQTNICISLARRIVPNMYFFVYIYYTYKIFGVFIKVQIVLCNN